MKTLGLDIGGTNVRAGIVDETGTILSEARGRSRAEHSFDGSMAAIIGVAREAIGDQRVEAIGWGCRARTDRPMACVSLVRTSIDRGGDGNVTEPLAKAFGVPVRLINDANAAGLGEFTYGAARDVQDMVMITLGTGIGGAIIIGGRMLLGASESAAEIGHMLIDPDGPACGCGNHGCYEKFAARDAIIDIAVRKMQAGENDGDGVRLAPISAY